MVRRFKDELRKDLCSGYLDKSYEDLILGVKIGLGNIKSGFISDSIERFYSPRWPDKGREVIMSAIKFFSICCLAREKPSDSFLVRIVVKRNTFNPESIFCRYYEIVRKDGQWRIKRSKKC